ncbi:unnamed protein product [Arctia plantaginis]|uniref:Amino acid transporter transmembrane domain-containing protein n=1 Tax=Arctia plantaginis TaxID=874455 RepID=A0A8S1BCA4_ARCPL|nr:unnamed protein product [Arctia plantaginis]CAB3256038.1 unnamed protein product [Arctia plantaginis]
MAAAAEDRNFKNYAKTQEEEDAYDYVKERGGMITTSFAGSCAHIIKGALGGGILSGPVAYKRAGVAVAVPLNIMFGIFMCYGLYLLVRCKKILMRRTRRTHLSYADCGEASLMLFPKKGLARFSKVFRYAIDAAVCTDLFGACCTYQIVVAKSLKQLIENTQTTKIAGAPGYPSLRIYLLIMLPFFCIICLIRHLKYLAPFSHAANGVVASSIMMTIYYCFQYNPQFEGLALATNFDGTFQFLGMSVFAMSCSGVVVAIEGNMKDPTKFTRCLLIGHLFIIVCTTATSFFGYAAFLDKAEAPFTINFPMTT